jgi:hypothetical protein
MIHSAKADLLFAVYTGFKSPAYWRGRWAGGGYDKSALSLSSRNCFLATSEGAWVMRHVAF